MARIHLGHFEGMHPEVNPRLMPKNAAQIAHNCLLTDGTIRPYPEWVLEATYQQWSVGHMHSLVYDTKRKRVAAYGLMDAVQLYGTPFAEDVIVGGPSPDWQAEQVLEAKPGDYPYNCAIPAPQPWNVSITYQRTYDSERPVNRLYGITTVRKHDGTVDEGPMTVLSGQNPMAVLYEGDSVEVRYKVSGEGTHTRLYRTISGLDTGETITNENDTNWHLVAELPIGNAVYIDGNSATALPLDVYYAGSFHPITFWPEFFGLTEDGFFVAANADGTIAVSERFKYHAWPVENYVKLEGVTITDIAVKGNNVFVGTETNPFVLAISIGDKAAQIGVYRFQEHLPCRRKSMYPAPSGALYASPQGLVSLSREGPQIITREIVDAGTDLATFMYEGPASSGDWIPMQMQVAIGTTTYGAYHDGAYYGFAAPDIEPNLG